MLTYSFQVLDVNEFDSLQVIISVVYKALTVLGKVQHVQPAGDDVDVVHPGVGGVVKVPSSWSMLGRRGLLQTGIFPT